jgi:hypothetical protein
MNKTKKIIEKNALSNFKKDDDLKAARGIINALLIMIIFVIILAIIDVIYY